MTPPRHGAGAGQDDPHDPRAYEDPGAFEAAVHRLADPLNDPLPGAEPGAPRQQAPYDPQSPQQAPQEWYDPGGYQRDWYGLQEPVQQPLAAPPSAPDPYLPADPGPAASYRSPAAEAAEPATEVFARMDAGDPVVPLPRPETEPTAGADEFAGEPDAAAPPPAPPPTGGRAERRRAAKGRGRRRPAPRPGPESAAPAKPMTRMEARRAAKAAKDSPAIVISRGIGELFITLGVLMLLFVTYQLWWTNVRADRIAGRETHKIQDDWAKSEKTPEKQGAFEPGQGFAIIHIPKLDVVTPIAEGTSKDKVLDRGMVGHYSEKPLKTAMPSAKEGNFALAGHRNTHGEPFRYINRLKPGDPIVVETREAYYTYEMTSVLPQTSPSNVSVIAPVPKQSGFTEPGRYITLTTCTPEFTSTYRLIVWGKMVDERPRSEGKPDVLAD
ncbi:class E sortase [Streptomyces sp. NPDC057249]|uniref:class E sortase n=1 Tax=Streptomyces sp. NPDC057249 TaxID=3346067 RepID=UPI00362AB0FF